MNGFEIPTGDDLKAIDEILAGISLNDTLTHALHSVFFLGRSSMRRQYLETLKTLQKMELKDDQET